MRAKPDATSTRAVKKDGSFSRLSEEARASGLLKSNQSIPTSVWLELQKHPAVAELRLRNPNKLGDEELEPAVEATRQALRLHSERGMRGRGDDFDPPLRIEKGPRSWVTPQEVKQQDVMDDFYIQQLERLPAVREFRGKLPGGRLLTAAEVWLFMTRTANQVAGFGDLGEWGYGVKGEQVWVTGPKYSIDRDGAVQASYTLQLKQEQAKQEQAGDGAEDVTPTQKPADLTEHVVTHFAFGQRAFQADRGMENGTIFSPETLRPVEASFFHGPQKHEEERHEHADRQYIRGYAGTAVGDALDAAMEVCRLPGRYCHLSLRDALLFLLTGDLPAQGCISAVFPQFAVYGTDHDQPKPEYITPRRFILSVCPWTSAKSLAKFYQTLQESFSDKGNRQIDEHGLELFQFVSKQLAEASPRPTWLELLGRWQGKLKGAWNVRHPEGKDEDYRSLRTRYFRLRQRLFPDPRE